MNIIERLTGDLKAKRETNRVNGDSKKKNRVGSRQPNFGPTDKWYNSEKNKTIPHRRGIRPKKNATKSEKRQHARDVTRGINTMSGKKKTNESINSATVRELMAKSQKGAQRPNEKVLRQSAKTKQDLAKKRYAEMMNNKKTNESALERAQMIIEKLSAANKAKREASRGPAGRSGRIQHGGSFAKLMANPKAQPKRGSRPVSSASKEAKRKHNRDAGGFALKRDPLVKSNATRKLRTKKANRPTFTARNSRRESVEEGWEVKGFSKSGVKSTPAGDPKTKTPGKTYRDSMGVKTKVLSYDDTKGGISRSTKALHSTTKTKAAIDRLARMKSKKNEETSPLDLAMILIERLTASQKGKREQSRERSGGKDMGGGGALRPVGSKADKRNYARDQGTRNSDPLKRNKITRPNRASQLRQARFSQKVHADFEKKLTTPGKKTKVHEGLSSENKSKRESSRERNGHKEVSSKMNYNTNKLKKYVKALRIGSHNSKTMRRMMNRNLSSKSGQNIEDPLYDKKRARESKKKE